MEPDSLLVRGLVDNASRGLSPALDRSTTFERVPGGTSPYGRGHAPVAAEAEALLGALEDAEATVFASGMTAWTCICLTLLGQGKVLVIPTSGYYEVELLGSEVLARFGVEVRRYDLRDPDGFRRACDGATLAIIETPSNPLLSVTDIREAAAAAHAGGALLCRDNTFGTPLLQRPLDLGADLAWQSATKYLAGHSDLLAGVVTTRDSALRERLVYIRRTIGGCSPPIPPGCCCADCARCTCGSPARSRRLPSSPAGSRPTPTCTRCTIPACRATRSTSSPCGRCRAGPAACWRSSSPTASSPATARNPVRLRAQRDQPRRRRDADRAPRPHRAPRAASRKDSCGWPSASRASTTSGPTSPRRSPRPCGCRRMRAPARRPRAPGSSRFRPWHAMTNAPHAPRGADRRRLPDVPGILAAMRLTPGARRTCAGSPTRCSSTISPARR